MTELATLLAEEYDLRRTVARLRERLHAEGGDPTAVLPDLAAAETALVQKEQERAAVEVAAPGHRDGQVTLGDDTTKLVATFTLRMAQVPTSIYHLLDAATDPLVSGDILNKTEQQTRRLRVTAYLDGYSSPSVETLEIKATKHGKFDLLPTLFPERLEQVHELTRATLNVLIEDLASTTGVELHRTTPVWLLPRTTAPLAVRDPQTGAIRDLTRYLGAFVTPNDPPVMAFLRRAAEHHPEKRLVGYQVDAAGVELQVKAMFEALKAEANITYVNSVIAFTPDDGTSTQRVRLPAESLTDQQANCIDGTVLMASLIEAASMNAAIVVVPGHAFVGWEKARGKGEWDYLETTMIGSQDFAVANQHARQLATTYEALRTQLNDESRFRRWSVRELRGQRITPLQ